MKQDPMEEWVLRDELLAAFHRWPIIVLFALGGALLGLLLAFLWPASYRASSELSVELNPYRVLDDQYIPEFSGVEFRNIDDYKHWQMLQLSIVVLSDPYMQETLTRLKEKDDEWSSVSPQDLREMLNANWRNAGQWNLTANGDTAEQAVEAVETWKEVVIEFTQESIANSRDLFRLELELRSLNDELAAIQLQQSTLGQIQADISESLDKFSSMPTEEVLSETDRLGLLGIANQLMSLLPLEGTIINSYPQESAPISETIHWLESVNTILDSELRLIELGKSELMDEISQIEAEWEENLIKASGLAATLNIENPQSGSTQVEEVRSFGMVMLVGALLGLLAWVIMLVFQITQKGYR